MIDGCHWLVSRGGRHQFQVPVAIERGHPWVGIRSFDLRSEARISVISRGLASAIAAATTLTPSTSGMSLHVSDVRSIPTTFARFLHGRPPSVLGWCSWSTASFAAVASNRGTACPVISHGGWRILRPLAVPAGEAFHGAMTLAAVYTRFCDWRPLCRLLLAPDNPEPKSVNGHPNSAFR